MKTTLSVVACVSLALPVAAQAPSYSDQWPARVFAPYVDVLLWPPFPLAQTAASVGTKYYTLGFVVDGGSCQASWGGVIPMADNHMLADIQALRQAQGEVMISFGGAFGVELAQGCTSVSALRAQYQAVIDRYGLTRVDFDVEGAALADSVSVQRRNQAIAGLQATARAAGRRLTVQYTLPVLPTGLTPDGVALLQNALTAGVRIGIVNVMAMDYGPVADPTRMGQNAIDAAQATRAQLRALLGPLRKEAVVRRMIGVTPMIGLNDVEPEVFTLTQDAPLLMSYAQQTDIGLLSMWSSTRDRPCPGAPHVSPTCSGVPQVPFAFSQVFKPFSLPAALGAAAAPRVRAGESVSPTDPAAAPAWRPGTEAASTGLRSRRRRRHAARGTGPRGAGAP